MIVDFFRAGGFTIWPVLLFSILVLVASAQFALKPAPKRLAIIRALTMALLFSSIAGLLTNFVAVSSKVTGRPEWANSPDVHLIILSGLGEAVTPAVLGFTSLSLAWLFVAVGARRRDDLNTDT